MKRFDAPPARRLGAWRWIRGDTAATARVRSALALGGLRRHPGSRGFTLIELLVVLMLMALLAAVAVPKLERLYSSIQIRTERDYILDQFSGLGRLALRDGRRYVVRTDGATASETPEPSGHRSPDTGGEPYVIDIPRGWTIQLSRPLVIGANGVCLGTELTLLHEGKVETRLALEAPYCRTAPHA
ncbi:MAG: prepilin-type N-terminal cleavage/methylation domain-containing protein [Defluviicoccus sp.]|nr:prepilin-type N-terminal cleavage/methylation domain-containing protein [Defluviicoccus sp.]MDE0278570.1 prepilin-type N-terminal cleavage/methylation domain-containing protein [Defluviicoccus sp.]